MKCIAAQGVGSDIMSGERLSRTVSLLDILVQKRKDKQAAISFFRKLIKWQRCSDRQLITDKLPSYSAAKKAVIPTPMHCDDRYANNRREAPHEHRREQERQMRLFKTPGHAQRFLAVQGQINNLFRLGRHLVRAIHHRVWRNQAFNLWQEVTCAH